jgi:hypothetical protein
MNTLSLWKHLLWDESAAHDSKNTYFQYFIPHSQYQSTMIGKQLIVMPCG